MLQAGLQRFSVILNHRYLARVVAGLVPAISILLPVVPFGVAGASTGDDAGT